MPSSNDPKLDKTAANESAALVHSEIGVARPGEEQAQGTQSSLKSPSSAAEALSDTSFKFEVERKRQRRPTSDSIRIIKMSTPSIDTLEEKETASQPKTLAKGLLAANSKQYDLLEGPNVFERFVSFIADALKKLEKLLLAKMAKIKGSAPAQFIVSPLKFAKRYKKKSGLSSTPLDEDVEIIEEDTIVPSEEEHQITQDLIESPKTAQAETEASQGSLNIELENRERLPQQTKI